jgi:hypothetical protein
MSSCVVYEFTELHPERDPVRFLFSGSITGNSCTNVNFEQQVQGVLSDTFQSL